MPAPVTFLSLLPWHGPNLSFVTLPRGEPARHLDTIIIVIVVVGRHTCATSKNAVCAWATTYFRRTSRARGASGRAPVCSAYTSAFLAVTPLSCCADWRPPRLGAVSPYQPTPSPPTPSTRTSGSRSTSRSPSPVSAPGVVIPASTPTSSTLTLYSAKAIIVPHRMI